jgi:DNA-binding NarL/FixJ family response regulator
MFIVWYCNLELSAFMAAATSLSREIARESADHRLLPKRKCHVLLIEDSKDAMEWVQHSLKKYGHGQYVLEWKEYLSDGLSRLSGGGIDVVLLDLGLPDCSGPFTTAWVHQAAPKVPIVVLTADESEDMGLSNLARGIRKYLVKGCVSCSGLVEAIGESLTNAA